MSQALVSRAFSGKGRISPETRARILKVAEDIGWHPNALARSVVTGDAPLVAVVTARLNFDWRAQVLSHLLKSIQAWHLKPLLFYAENDDDVDRLLGETMEWRTRGVIVMAGDIRARRAEAIISGGQFLATLNRPANHPDAFSVATDNQQGGAMAASLLVDEGRRKFLVLSGPQNNWASALRTQGFVEAIRSRGESVIIWHNEAMTMEAGKECAAAFHGLRHHERPDAVFATDDALALGFMDGVRGQTGIPADLSLLGFDNLAASSWLPYQLTTFEQPLSEMVGRMVHYINLHQNRPQDAFCSTSPHRIGEDGVVYCLPKIIQRSTTKPTP
ncbi:LacI family transcriptional regulator [Rhizobium sp. P32RR-XVIII]|nr:LacI family transcriptional regulator [Rhizobium sp. P32RR-XVIII]